MFIRQEYLKLYKHVRIVLDIDLKTSLTSVNETAEVVH